MKYFESYGYVFRSPKWLTNLAICAVALLVPIAGQMVVLGYHFDIIEDLHLRGRERYPDFDFNRLMKYLIRGAWPFLVQLVVGLIVGLLPGVFLGVSYFGFLISLTSSMPRGGGPVTAGPSAGTAVWGVLLAASILLVLVVQLVTHVVLVPMILRAGLMQDFGAGFSWPFIRDFVGRTWWPTVLVWLFLVVTSIPLGLLGLLFCFVGVYFTGAWAQFAESYLLYELYEQHLKRGGMEIPLQVESSRADVPDEEQ
jgi:hypothetical protein